MASRFYQCPNCRVFSSAGAWDMATIGNNCYNRKQRRAYKSIEVGKLNNWYECPECGHRTYKSKTKEEIRHHD